MSNDNSENNINVIFYSKTGIIAENYFSPFSSFKEISNYIAKNYKDNDLNFPEKYLINNRQINENSKLSEIFSAEESLNITKKEIWIEIQHKNKFNSNENLQLKYILTPIDDPFYIAVYNTKTGVFSVEQYPDETNLKYSLNKFNETSAYCNSPNYLFISGGQYLEENLKNFWIINNQLYSVKEQQLPYTKSNHSMLYLREGYVLITGGNNLKTFYYDVNKNNFVECGDLHFKHKEPALIRYENFIYCLNDINENNLFFERINIFDGTQKPIWQRIYPNFLTKNSTFFNNKYFGTCYSDDGNIIIAGGSYVNNYTYLYDVENNILSLTDGKDEEIYMGEKTFYKLNNKYNIAVSRDFENKKAVFILNRKDKKVEKIGIDPNEGNINYNFIIDENNLNNSNDINITLRIFFKSKDCGKKKIKYIGNKLPNYIKNFINNNDTDVFEEIFDEKKNDNIETNNTKEPKKVKNILIKNKNSDNFIGKNKINYNSNEVPRNNNNTFISNKNPTINNTSPHLILSNSVILHTDNSNNNDNTQKTNKKRNTEIYPNKYSKKNCNNNDNFSETNANGISNIYNSVNPNLDKIKNRINNALSDANYLKKNHQLKTTKYSKNDKNKKKLQNEIYQKRTNFKDILEEKIGEKIIEIEKDKTAYKINPNEFCDYKLPV